MLHCRMQQVKSDWKEVSAIKPSLSKVSSSQQKNLLFSCIS